jgi:hypothetical protein
LGFNQVTVVGKLVKNNKGTVIYKRRNNTQNNTKAQNTQNRKMYKIRKNIRRILEDMSSN